MSDRASVLNRCIVLQICGFGYSFSFAARLLVLQCWAEQSFSFVMLNRASVLQRWKGFQICSFGYSFAARSLDSAMYFCSASVLKCRIELGSKALDMVSDLRFCTVLALQREVLVQQCWAKLQFCKVG
jgi:hypothetical protein